MSVPGFYSCVLCSSRPKTEESRKLDGPYKKQLHKFLQQKFFIESANLFSPGSVICSTHVDCDVPGRWVQLNLITHIQIIFCVYRGYILTMHNLTSQQKCTHVTHKHYLTNTISCRKPLSLCYLQETGSKTGGCTSLCYVSIVFGQTYLTSCLSQKLYRSFV